MRLTSAISQWALAVLTHPSANPSTKQRKLQAYPDHLTANQVYGGYKLGYIQCPNRPEGAVKFVPFPNPHRSGEKRERGINKHAPSSSLTTIIDGNLSRLIQPLSVQRSVQEYAHCLALSLQSQLCWVQRFLFKIHSRISLETMFFVFVFFETGFIVPIAADTTPIVSAVTIVRVKATVISWCPYHTGMNWRRTENSAM